MLKEGKFLRLNINDDYNNKMNNVDIADQLRNQYRPDRWMRKQKWWWSMFFWGHGTMLVNAFVSYKRFMEINNREPLSHYEFLQKVVLAKLCREKYGSWATKRSVAIQKGNKRAISRAENTRSKRQCVSSVSSISSARTSSSTGSSKPTTIGSKEAFASSDSDLNSKRLNTNACHLPEPNMRTRETKGGKCCILCRWATGKKLSAGLLHCQGCDVNLCGECYKLYHTVPEFDDAVKQKVQHRINQKSNKSKGKGKKK